VAQVCGGLWGVSVCSVGLGGSEQVHGKGDEELMVVALDGVGGGGKSLMKVVQF